MTFKTSGGSEVRLRERRSFGRTLEGTPCERTRGESVIDKDSDNDTGGDPV